MTYPKKVVENILGDKYSKNNGKYFCPKCEEKIVTKYKKGRKYSECSNCGRYIKW